MKFRVKTAALVCLAVFLFCSPLFTGRLEVTETVQVAAGKRAGAAPDEDPFQVTDDILSDQELNDLLYELSLEDGGEADFLVLPEDYSPPVTGLAGVYHLLLIGVDTAGQGISGRSDTMVLAVINTRQQSIKLVSFMRDLYVRIPGHGHNRLNAAYIYGGPDLLVKTIQAAFNLPVDGYLAVDFALMARLVDALGGIRMDVKEDELSPLNGILAYYNYLQGRPEEEGLLEHSGGGLLLTGPQAMAYARIRSIDSDFQRVRRQQTTLEAIFQQVMGMDSGRLASLIANYSLEVRTNVTLADALALVPVAFSLKDASLRALTVPVKAAFKHVTKNKAAIMVPNLQRNIRAINTFLSEP